MCKDDLERRGLVMDTQSNSDGLIVRVIEPGDAAAVSVLIGQLGYERSAQQVLEWIAGAGSGIEQAAFVACLHGQVVGWIEVSIVRHLQAAPHALVGGLVVKEGLRGRGVGRHLCRRAEEWSWSRSLTTVRVMSRSTRPDAHRFYLRDGYGIVKTSLVLEKHRSC